SSGGVTACTERLDICVMPPLLGPMVPAIEIAIGVSFFCTVPARHDAGISTMTARTSACAANDTRTIRLRPSASRIRRSNTSLTASCIGLRFLNALPSLDRLGHDADLLDARFPQLVGHVHQILDAGGPVRTDEHRLVFLRAERLPNPLVQDLDP